MHKVKTGYLKIPKNCEGSFLFNTRQCRGCRNKRSLRSHFFFKEFPGLPLDNPQTTYFFSAKESQQGLNYL